MTDAPAPAGRPAEFVLLMTATVAPTQRVAATLARSDPKVRLADYQAALRFWLTLPAPWLAGVVFAENSAYPLDGMARETARWNTRNLPIEFLSFDDPGPPEGLDYGYCEFKLMRDAVERSGLIARNRYFVKATGRYTFPKVDRLIARLPSDFRIAVDSRYARPLTTHRHYLTSIALAIFEREFFRRQLANLTDKMVPAPPWSRRQFVENVLYDELSPRRNEPGIILRWPCGCPPSGIGANGDDYSRGRKRLKETIRAVVRAVVPDLWL